MGAIPYECYRFSYQRAQKQNEAHVSASSGQPEKNMILKGERGTSEVHHEAFDSEMSVCQVLVWDSRSVVETSQVERHIPISIRLVYLSRIRTTYAGSCASSFFRLINAQQFLLVQWKSLKAQILSTHILIRRAWINPSIASLPRHYDNLAAD